MACPCATDNRKLIAKEKEGLLRPVVDPVREGESPGKLARLLAIDVRTLYPFGVHLGEVSVGRIMRPLGFAAQSALKRAYKQNPRLGKKGCTSDFPMISRRAKRERAQIIYSADQAGGCTDDDRGQTWSTTGETPIVKRAGARFSLNMLSAVSSHGWLRLMIREGIASAETFCTFLKRLVPCVKSNLFRIVDGQRIDPAKSVQVLLKAHALSALRSW